MFSKAEMDRPPGHTIAPVTLKKKKKIAGNYIRMREPRELPQQA